jgi:hypothetical protein
MEIVDFPGPVRAGARGRAPRRFDRHRRHHPHIFTLGSKVKGRPRRFFFLCDEYR